MDNNNEGRRYKVIQILKNDRLEINKKELVLSILPLAVAVLNFFGAYLNDSLIQLNAAVGWTLATISNMMLVVEEKTECECKISELSEKELEELMSSGTIVEDIIEVYKDENIQNQGGPTR